MATSPIGFNKATGRFEVISPAALSSLMGLPSEFAQIALSLADIKGAAQGMMAGVADAFDDTSGVSSSTGFSYDSLNGAYRAGGAEATQSIPAMTSASAPSPWIVESVNVNRNAWMAFNHARETGANNTYGFGLVEYIRRTTSTGIRAAAYSLRSFGPTENPTSVTVYGRNNNTGAWTTLDARTGLTWSSAGQVQTFSIASPAIYTDYRFLVSTGASSAVTIDEIEIYQANGDGSGDLRSVSYTAFSAPSRAMLTILAKVTGGTITANTNLKGYVSRNGGANWTQATLVAGVAASGLTTYEAVGIDISGQPSGTAMRFRVETVATSGAAFEVSGVALQWGNA